MADCDTGGVEKGPRDLFSAVELELDGTGRNKNWRLVGALRSEVTRARVEKLGLFTNDQLEDIITSVSQILRATKTPKSGTIKKRISSILEHGLKQLETILVERSRRSEEDDDDDEEEEEEGDLVMIDAETVGKEFDKMVDTWASKLKVDLDRRRAELKDKAPSSDDAELSAAAPCCCGPAGTIRCPVQGCGSKMGWMQTPASAENRNKQPLDKYRAALAEWVEGGKNGKMPKKPTLCKAIHACQAGKMKCVRGPVQTSNCPNIECASVGGCWRQNAAGDWKQKCSLCISSFFLVMLSIFVMASEILRGVCSRPIVSSR
jgi:hypothetical protein